MEVEVEQRAPREGWIQKAGGFWADSSFPTAPHKLERKRELLEQQRGLRLQQREYVAKRQNGVVDP